MGGPQYKHLLIQFEKGTTIINKSNIHEIIYGVFGGLIGAILIHLLIK